MPHTLAFDPCEETYHDVVRFIDKMVRDFYKRNGAKWVRGLCGPYEDLRGVADEIFLEAYRTYDPKRGLFSTWLGYKVWKGLMEVLRRAACRDKKLRRVDVDFDLVPEGQKPFFDVGGLLAKLSRDGRRVVRVAVISPPNEIALTLAQRRSERPPAYRAAVREFLYDLGWSAQRVRESFDEITKALS